jgi:predicted flap endonuclease-1-like 5' DNA nuclease
MFLLAISFCSIPWWLLALLPFLLGLLAGWLLWDKSKSQIDEIKAQIGGSKTHISGLESDIEGYKIRIAKLEAELVGCNGKLTALDQGGLNWKEKRADLNSQIALLQGQLREKSSSIQGIASIPVVPLPLISSDAGDGMHAYTKALGSGNLQIVEGIGTKMSELLKGNDINTWSELGVQTPEGLRSLLDGINESKYRIIDPATWPQQASLAAADKWEELIDLQKNLDGGKDTGGGITDAKVEKMLINIGAIRRFKKDDLTAIEGVGPKTAQLMKDQGIETWQALSETAVDRIQGILNDAGSRFKLSDPGTWPKQAAARGEWDELQAYQDFLNGGKA